MPKTAFSTLSCPDWSWYELLENGSCYGYDGVEIRLVAQETDLLSVPDFRPAELAKRRRELADAGFQVCGLASSVRFDYPEKSERERQIEIGRAYVDLAVELGASFVRVFGDVLPETDDVNLRQEVIGNIAEGLDRLGEYAEEQIPGISKIPGISIVIETHGDFSDSHIVRETFERINRPAVGVLWDTHHPWRFYDEPIPETVERLGKWVRHTHWKDSLASPRREAVGESQAAAKQAHQLMSGHRHADYVLFGEGEFPALECMKLLREIGYEGWFSLEWEKMWHPELEEPEIALPPFPSKIRALWDAAG